MAHRAFDAWTAVRGCASKVECAAMWEGSLLVGCSDGSLRVYGEPTEDLQVQNAAHHLKPVETRIGFARKSILQMEVLHSKRLLITLADGVSVHSLPDFDMVTHFGKTRGANIYSWNNGRGILCAAVKKKLVFVKFIGNREFLEMKEVLISDTVRTMAWSGDCVLVGLINKREYWVVDVISGLLTEISSSGRFAPPLAVALPGAELLLGKDNISVFVDNQGKSTRPGEAISWSEAPLAVVVSPPYVVGKLSRFIEVRSLRPGHALVQTFAFNNITSLSGSMAGILASSERDVHYLKPIPLGVQIVQLAVAGKYKDALALCALLPPDDAHVRASKEDSIHIQYGYHLFSDGKFEEAMEHFSKSTLDLPSVLHLFPSIQLPDVSAELSAEAHPSALSSESSKACIDSWEGPESFEFSSGNRDVDGVGPEEPLKGSELAQALVALVAYLTGKRLAAVQKADSEQSEVDVSELLKQGAKEKSNTRTGGLSTAGEKKKGDLAVQAGTATVDDKMKVSHMARSYATVLDSALVQALLVLDSSAPIAEFESSSSLQISSSEDTHSATDTALSAARTSAFRKASESAIRLGAKPIVQHAAMSYATAVLLQLLEGPNYCDASVCASKMREAGKFLELVTLYRRRGLHKKALQLLQELGKVDGPKPTIEYLQALGSKESSLILEYSQWLLREHPQQALQLFISLDPPLPTGLLLEHFKNYCPPLRAAYLEHLLGTVGDAEAPAGLHDELVQLHLDRVLEEREKILTTGGYWDETCLNESRGKLMSILEISSNYTPATMLARLPREAMHMEQALLLAKMRLHLPALALYARKMRAVQQCLDYCDQVYRTSGASTTNPDFGESATIYIILLQVYLEPTYTIKEFNRTLTAILPPAKSPAPSFTREVGVGNGRPTKLNPPSKLTGALLDSNGELLSNGDTSVADKVQRNITRTSKGSGAAQIGDDWGLDKGVMLQEALAFMAKRWDRINPSTALAMLPPSTPLKDVIQYLEPIIRKASELQRNGAVIKSLRRAENLQVRSELLVQRQRMIKVSGEQSCAICHKRIGSSVFAVYPNNMVVHFVCHQDQLGRRRAGL